MQNNGISTLPFNNPLIRFIADRKYRWLRHTLFLLLGLILAFKGDVGAYNDMRSPEMKSAFIWVDVWTFIFITPPAFPVESFSFRGLFCCYYLAHLFFGLLC
jgi:hypothetical protein